MRCKTYSRIVTALASVVALLPAGASADQIVAGRDVTVGQTVPMSAFLRFDRGPQGAVHVDAWEVRSGHAVQAYDIDMTKLMHMIVVSDDLTEFQHVHPALLPNGHFSIELHLAHPQQAYHIYLDGLPNGAGRHVFRFDLPSQGGAPVMRQLHPSGSSVNVGPYRVTIDPTSVPFGEIATISVHILKDGRPADDLHPYLGVMSHGVLIGTKDLAYMHAHGMTEEMLAMMSGANDCGDSMMMAMTPMPPDLNIGNQFEFEVLAPSEQDYDFWIQFVGGKTVYTAPLLVTTR
jgi:hypothetical protein